jgi:hypothetical protein
LLLCSQVSWSLLWVCLTWWTLLMLMPTDMCALCVENVTSHGLNWTDMFDMSVVELGTSYSAGCVDEDFPDQTILDSIVTFTHCRNFSVNYCVCWKSVMNCCCDLRFLRNVKWQCNVPSELSFLFWNLLCILVLLTVVKDVELISRT